jgi:hypothetical protein
MKQTLRASDPTYVQEEWQAFKETPAFKQEEKDFYALLDESRRGGASYRGEFTSDVLGAYNNFMKGQREAFSNERLQADKMHIAKMKEQGLYTRAQAKDATDRLNIKAKYDVANINNAAARSRLERDIEAKQATVEDKQEFDREMAKYDFTNRAQEKLAQRAWQEKVSAEDFKRQQTLSREAANKAFKLEAMKQKGKEGEAFERGFKSRMEARAKFIESYVTSGGTQKKELGISPGEREFLGEQFDYFYNEAQGKEKFQGNYSPGTQQLMKEDGTVGSVDVMIGKKPEGGVGIWRLDTGRWVQQGEWNPRG